MNRSRWLLLLCIVSLLILEHARLCFSDVCSGIVVDGSNGSRGIPGVIVAAGYGLDRTVTDSSGRFSLDIAESGIQSRLIHQPFLNPTIKWNMRQRLLDLTVAPGIKSVSIYRPDGSCFWKKTLGRTNEKRLIATPPMAPGLYLVTFTRSDNSRFTWRTIQGAGGGSCIFTLPSYGTSTNSTADASTKSINLIFRHDRYFPLDRQIQTPATDLVIQLQADPTAVFFDMTKIHTLSFTLTNEDSLSMEREAIKEEFIPADLKFNDTDFGRVGLRYKGSDDYAMPRCFDENGNRSAYADCNNVSLKVKFNEYTDTARLYGMKRLNLHSMSYDNSKLREMLAYELFRQSGLYTCRTVFVKVLVNGVSRGMFAGVEEIDGRFTKSRWHETGDGNLYKEVWPIYTTEKKYRLALKTNEKPEDSADVNRMVNFCNTIKASTPQTFAAMISPFMDIDYWLRFILVDRAIHNGDGVMTWYVSGSSSLNHNYYFYEDNAPGGKFWIIPWDMNATFTKTDPIFDDYGMPEWNEKPDSCAPMEVWNGNFAIPPNCDKLTNLTADIYWNRFVSLGEQFLDVIFTPERMKERINAWAKVIEPFMNDDPFVQRKAWTSNVELLCKMMTSLHNGLDDYIYSRGSKEDTTGYDTPFPGDSGFTSSLLNNFEFGTEFSIDSWAHALISDKSSINLFRDTVLPLGGKADLRCTYSLRPADTTKDYSEWVMIMLDMNHKHDCSAMEGLRINLKSDVTRQVSIGLLSDVYARNGVGGGEWYCWVVVVGPKARQFTLDIRDIDYPDWVPHDRPALIDSVLVELSGIWVSPSPRYGGNGELQVVPDSGFLKIDNILFIGASK